MVNQDLINYINQAKAEGKSEQQIKEELLKVGWAQTDIDQAFNSLTIPSDNAFSIPKKPSSASIVIKIISVLYFLGAILTLGFGVLMLSGANFFNQILGAEWGFFSKYFLIGGIIFIIISILGIFVGVGLWRNKNWAKLTAIFLFFLVVLLSVGGKTTIFKSRVVTPDANLSNDQPMVATSTIAIKKPQTLSPKESYLAMRRDVGKIKSYADLEAHTLKYGSKAQIANLEAKREQINALPQSFKDQVVALIIEPLSSEITTIQETINGNIATLDIQTNKPGLKGTVTLVLENGQWKLEEESWVQP